MTVAEKGDAKLAEVDVLLNTGFGVRTDQQADIKKLWPKLTGLKWMHAASAGILPFNVPFEMQRAVLHLKALSISSTCSFPELKWLSAFKIRLLGTALKANLCF